MPTCNNCGKPKPDHTFQACPSCRLKWRKAKRIEIRKTIDSASVFSFLSAVATGQKHNTPEWMEYIRDEANALITKMGYPERFEISKHGNFQIGNVNK